MGIRPLKWRGLLIGAARFHNCALSRRFFPEQFIHDDVGPIQVIKAHIEPAALQPGAGVCCQPRAHASVRQEGDIILVEHVLKHAVPRRALFNQEAGIFRLDRANMAFPAIWAAITLKQISRASGGEKCATRHITEEEVYGAFSSIVQKLIAQRPEVVAACEQVLAELMDTTQLDQKRAKLQAEQTRITERVEAMMTRASREVVEDFTEQYAALEAEMNRVTGKLDAVEREKAERGYRERQCRLLLKALPTAPSNDEESVESRGDLFLALVDRVVVGDGLTFILRDGTKWER